MNDFSITRAGQLGDLKQGEDQRLEQVAKQFEALFIGLLMKQKKVFGDQDGAIFGQSSAEKNYQELMDNALAESSAGGLGIADAMLDQLRVRVAQEQKSADAIDRK